jgi:hypothetical protein
MTLAMCNQEKFGVPAEIRWDFHHTETNLVWKEGKMAVREKGGRKEGKVDLATPLLILTISWMTTHLL